MHMFADVPCVQGWADNAITSPITKLTQYKTAAKCDYNTINIIGLRISTYAIIVHHTM